MNGKKCPDGIRKKFKDRTMELLTKGWTLREIGKELGITSSFAFQLACENKQYKDDLIKSIRRRLKKRIMKKSGDKKKSVPSEALDHPHSIKRE